MSCRVPHKRLSEAFDVLTLDLQARADAATARAGACAQDGTAQPARCQDAGAQSGLDSSRAFHGQQRAPQFHSGVHGEPASGWEHDSFVEVPITSDGLCNAVLIWFEADHGGGHSLSSWHGGCGSFSDNPQPSEESAAGKLDSNGRGRHAGAEGSDGERPPDAVMNGAEPDGLNSARVASSWSQGIQYLDGVHARQARVEPMAYVDNSVSQVSCILCSNDPLCHFTTGNQVYGITQGKSIELRVRQDAGQLHFASDPPQRRPRHAYLPRWHFDMVRGAQRGKVDMPDDAYVTCMALLDAVSLMMAGKRIRTRWYIGETATLPLARPKRPSSRALLAALTWLRRSWTTSATPHTRRPSGAPWRRSVRPATRL